MAEDISSLLQKLAGITVESPEELVAAFAQVLSIDAEQAAFFLSAANYNLEVAVNLYLDSNSVRAPRAVAWRPLQTAAELPAAYADDLMAQFAHEMEREDMLSGRAVPVYSMEDEIDSTSSAVLPPGMAAFPVLAAPPAPWTAPAAHVPSVSPSWTPSAPALGGALQPATAWPGFPTVASPLMSQAPGSVRADATTTLPAPSFALAAPSFGQAYPTLATAPAHSAGNSSTFTGHIPPASNAMDDD